MTKDKKKKKFSLGNWLEVQLLYKNLFFLLFLTILGVVYIANGHNAEKKVRRIMDLETEIEKSRWMYWESQSGVDYEGIQSRTEKRVDELGLKAGEGSLRILESDNVPKEDE